VSRLIVVVVFAFVTAAGPTRAALVPRLHVDPAVVAMSIDAIVGATVGATSRSDLLSAFRAAPAAPRARTPSTTASSSTSAARERASLRLPLVDLMPAASPVVALPRAFSWVEEESRAFWYAAGAGAATTLGTHVLVGVPTAVLGGMLVGSTTVTHPAAALALSLGVLGGYLFAEALLSSFVSLLVFDGSTDVYDGHYLPALAAHFAGNLFAAATVGLLFGGGGLLVHGASMLSVFTGSSGLTGLTLFAGLAALPGIVVAAVALIGVPALVTAWGLSASATPAAGHALDEKWLSPTARAVEPARHERFVAADVPLWSMPLPAP
jgi:hypothetical protein